MSWPNSAPTNERQAAFQGHRDAERELVRRRDIGEPGVRVARHSAIDVHPGTVDRHGNDARVSRRECVPGSRVAWLLEPHLVSRIDQQASDQIDRLLRTRHDDDLLRTAVDASSESKVRRDGRAKRGETVW